MLLKPGATRCYAGLARPPPSTCAVIFFLFFLFILDHRRLSSSVSLALEKLASRFIHPSSIANLQLQPVADACMVCYRLSGEDKLQ